MKAKIRLLLFLMLSTFSLSTWAQSKESKQIITQLQLYFEATQNKNWNAVMDQVYPKIFDSTPREQIIAMFNDMEARGMKMDFITFEITSISDVKKSGAEKFALVRYLSEFTLEFITEEYHTEEIMSMMLKSFQTNYGAENVEYFAEEFRFKIKGNKQIFAVAEKKGSEWKFIEYTADNASKMDLFIPDEVRNALLAE
jgi:hypothetical protein